MTPILYILMRTDLESMNPGKAMAQASHATDAFHHAIANPTHSSQYTVDSKEYLDWKNSTSQGFGTVLVLAVNAEQMHAAVDKALNRGFTAGAVADPTYPYILPKEYADLIPESRDTLERIDKGKEVVLFRAEETCAFVFCCREHNMFPDLSLHK